MKFALLGSLLMLGACSQSHISERDIKNRQREDQANLKRQELETVAGVYEGIFHDNSGVDTRARLTLEVREVQETTAEGVDPVLVPRIMGYLRLIFGDEALREYADAVIVESDYKPSESFIHLIAENEQHFGRMSLKLEFSNEKKTLIGPWSASKIGGAGKLSVAQKDPQT